MQTLLALIDFSDVTPAVLHTAIEIARAFHMKLLVLHVSTPDADYEGHDMRADISRSAVASEMHRIHRALHVVTVECTRLGVDATALLVRGTSSRGNPVPKMISEAARLQPALIVMGRHGHGRMHDALLGSASAAVVRKAACPVLLIPRRTAKFLWPASDPRRGGRTKSVSPASLAATGRAKKAR